MHLAVAYRFQLAISSAAICYLDAPDQGCLTHLELLFNKDAEGPCNVVSDMDCDAESVLEHQKVTKHLYAPLTIVFMYGQIFPVSDCT